MKLNYKRTIFVGLAFFLITSFWQAYDTIVPKILTDKFGMPQSWSGVIMALDNVLALFLLPLFGTISDKVKFKRGRRTPFIIFGTLCAAVFLLVLSFADNTQRRQLEAVDPSNPTALLTLWDADLTVTTPGGKTLQIQDEFAKEEFTAISLTAEDGSTNPDYLNYVVPARQGYAAAVTAENRGPLVFFVAMLLLALLSMATFRSPAVALMPDVTIKPLRSKANAIINLMGAAGGIIVLIFGTILGAGRPENALMSYTGYFAFVSLLMLLSLAVFLWKVKEPRFAEEMQRENEKYGIDTDQPDDPRSGGRKLTGPERRSLLFILASVVLWYFGYNAVTSKYSVYAGSVLNLDYSLTLTIAMAAAILAYIPAGMVASKIGRKKTILAGIIILGFAFSAASFMRAGSSILVMNILFALAGIGWATINVNSYPMAVELARGGDVGKYTGFYYTASMASQTVTPILSGVFLDIKMTTLFPYGALFVLLAFVTMLFVRHGDNRPVSKKGLEAMNVDSD